MTFNKFVTLTLIFLMLSIPIYGQIDLDSVITNNANTSNSTDNNSETNNDQNSQNPDTTSIQSKRLDMSPPQNRSGNNYCGQYAMAMCLQYLGVSTEFSQVYQESNPAGIFTAPPTIEKYLRSKMIDARVRQNGNANIIIEQINADLPVILLVDAGGSPHWVTIIGYKKSAQLTEFEMYDSYWGVRNIKTFTEQELLPIWEKPLLTMTGGNILTNLTNYRYLYVTLSRPQDVSNFNPGTHFSTSPEDLIGGGLNDVVTGWENRRPGQIVGGVVDALGGLASAIPTMTGRLGQDGAERLSEIAQNELSQEGFGHQLLGNLAQAGSQVLNGLGTGLEAVGNTLGTALSHLREGISNVAGRIEEGLSSLFSIFR